MRHTFQTVRRFGYLAASLYAMCFATGAWAASDTRGAAFTGTIAYIRGGTEIRLIRPDGTGDRKLWEQPPTQSRYGDIRELAFRPDGQELVFASSHEKAISYYESDLYGLGLDGKGVRRLTNAPSPSQLANYQKCKVAITVINSSRNPLAFVLNAYVVGAPKPKTVAAGPNGTGTVVFDGVAVIPGALQPVMVAVGEDRWPGPPLRLVPGRTNTASITLTGRGFKMMGAYCPVWTPDGKIAYRFGSAAGIYKVSAQGTPGTGIGIPLGGKTISRIRAFDLGPSTVPGGGLLYTPGFNDLGEDDRSIYQTDEEGQKQTQLVHFGTYDGGTITQIRWLPDHSGFLFVRGEPLTFGEGANIVRCDLATRRQTKLTDFQKEAVRDFAISPDGNWIVFERGQAVYNPWDKTRPALWIMRIDGSDQRLLVEDAWSPAWGK